MLSWLESHGRRVVNGRRVLELEMSKALESALDTGQLDQPADHTWLLQDYLDPVGGFITRIEVVGARSWW